VRSGDLLFFLGAWRTASGALYHIFGHFKALESGVDCSADNRNSLAVQFGFRQSSDDWTEQVEIWSIDSDSGGKHHCDRLRYWFHLQRMIDLIQSMTNIQL